MVSHSAVMLSRSSFLDVTIFLLFRLVTGPIFIVGLISIFISQVQQVLPEVVKNVQSPLQFQKSYNLLE